MPSFDDTVDTLDTALDQVALDDPHDTEIQDALEAIAEPASLDDIDPTIRTRISGTMSPQDERRWLVDL